MFKTLNLNKSIEFKKFQVLFDSMLEPKIQPTHAGYLLDLKMI